MPVPRPVITRPAGRRRLGAALAGAAVTMLLAGCGSGSPSPSAELADRARSGLEQSYSATYELVADGGTSSTATVRVEPGRVRLDVRTADGVATSIRDGTGTVSCQTATDGRATCLQVAGPGEDAEAVFDPTLRRLFGDVLQVLAERPDGVEVAAADPVEVPADVEDVRCFDVGGDLPAFMTPGSYCLTADGVPAHTAFGASTATLTALDGAPTAADFAPPASPTPLPTG